MDWSKAHIAVENDRVMLAAAFNTIEQLSEVTSCVVAVISGMRSDFRFAVRWEALSNPDHRICTHNERD